MSKSTPTTAPAPPVKSRKEFAQVLLRGDEAVSCSAHVDEHTWPIRIVSLSMSTSLMRREPRPAGYQERVVQAKRRRVVAHPRPQSRNRLRFPAWRMLYFDIGVATGDFRWRPRRCVTVRRWLVHRLSGMWMEACLEAGRLMSGCVADNLAWRPTWWSDILAGIGFP